MIKKKNKLKKLKPKYKWSEQELHFHNLNVEREVKERLRKYVSNAATFGLFNLREEHHTGGILTFINNGQWISDEVIKLNGAPPTETSALEGETGTTNPAKTLFPLISDGLSITLNREEYGKD